jgi:hypothetical protein
MIAMKDDSFTPTGGWYSLCQEWTKIRWKHPSLLAAVGRGHIYEEDLAWKGHWNEDVVTAARTAIADPAVLTILLTGRNTDFSDLIKRMVKSKGLSFDLVVLNPKIKDLSSIEFKVFFLDDMLPPSAVEEIEIYEDREPHFEEFRKYFDGWERQKGGSRKATVHFVNLPMKYLERSVEKELIREMDVYKRTYVASTLGYIPEVVEVMA